MGNSNFDLFSSVIRFINQNGVLLVIGISILFVILFVIMIAKLKRLCLFEFVLFVGSFFIVGVHFVADLIGYIIYWNGRPDLTWILFAIVIYFIAFVIDLIVLIIRLVRKPERAEVVAPVEEAKPQEKEAPIVFNLDFDRYLETLDEPMGFYDERIDGYHLTKKMREMINLKSKTISTSDYRNFIIDDDQKVYDELVKQKSGKTKYRYRLKTVNGIEWFNEVKSHDGKVTVSTFHKSLDTKAEMAIFDRSDLEVDLSRKISVGDEFGLTFILINNNQNLINRIGKDATNTVIEEYLKTVQKDLFTNEDAIYKISSREYCIMTSDIDLYHDNIHMVKSKNSELLESTINYEGDKLFVTNVLGFVHSNSVEEKNSLEYVEAGRLALYLATNKECRYVEYDLNELKDNSLEFEKCKVDLSNKFLENL